MKNISNINKGIYKPFLFFLIIALSFSCENLLEEEVYSEMGPVYIQSEEGLLTLIAATYAEWTIADPVRFSTVWDEMTTDILWETGGGLEKKATLFINFAWRSDEPWFRIYYEGKYRAIRNANCLLDNIDQAIGISQTKRDMFVGEAKFLRAISYFDLYEYFGPVPLVTSMEISEYELERSTDEELKSYIENEMLDAKNLLPDDNQLGRASKASVMAFLTKFYLKNKQWQECADAAQEVISLNKYSLFPEIENLFRVENDANCEYIIQYTHDAFIGQGNYYMPKAFPPKYPIQDNWRNYGAQYRTYDAFYNSFHPDDRRRRMLITEYTNTDDEHIVLLGNDDVRSFKYWPDPNANGAKQGNDIPVIRYAHILLSRAEALNELNGPNQEVIDLINQVRARAEVPLLQLSDFPSKESLRDAILDERNWEFFTEGVRRSDLIRHGKFISQAITRGKNAQPYHVLFPFPQSEIDANPNLVQNEGY